MLTKADLLPYQTQAVEWMTSRASGMLWLNLGGGKTIISLTAIKETGLKTLVVATKRIIEHTWPDEIQKWEHVKSLRYVACTGTVEQRRRKMEQPWDVLGISYELLPWYYAQFHSQRDVGLLIFDEISKMKAHDTQRLRIHNKLCIIPRRFGLTATPASESYLGLWGQYQAVVKPNPLGKNISQFREAYVRSIFKGMYTEYEIDARGKERIEADIAPHTLVLEAEKRPEPTVIDVPIEWETPGVERIYRQVEKQLVVELEGKTWALASRAEVYGKCRQMATGFIYEDRNRAVRGDEKGVQADGLSDNADRRNRVGIETDPAKFSVLRDEYEALGGEPVLVFYQFVWEREILLRVLDGSELLEGDALERFNQGTVPALIVHPRSCGYGLNLQGSCRTVFWATLPDSGTDYIQANGRIDRQGQERQVIIKRFVRQRSIEEDVVARLDGKIDSMEQLIERMRGRQ